MQQRTLADLRNSVQEHGPAPFLSRFAKAASGEAVHDTIVTKVARETTDDR